jgi:hypothetical protein
MIIEHKALGMVQSVLGFQGDVMSQLSFSDVEYGAKRKKTKREMFLAEMDYVVPWDSMVKLIEPVYPKSAVGRHAYALSSMVRVYCMQQWYGLSDPANGRSPLRDCLHAQICRFLSGQWLDSR